MSETPVFNGVAVRPLGEPSRDVMGEGARPAVFEGKMLKRASTCPWHPKYQGKREPRGDRLHVACPRCLAIWSEIQHQRQLACDHPRMVRAMHEGSQEYKRCPDCGFEGWD